MARDSDPAATTGAHDGPEGSPGAGLTSVPSGPLGEVETRVANALDTEPALLHHIVVDIAIAIPVAIAVVVGMVALAVSIDGAALESPILMAVAIGVLAGIFFGTWAGFVSTAHEFEQLDRMQGRAPGH
jgi:hypothetical protein